LHGSEFFRLWGIGKLIGMNLNLKSSVFLSERFLVHLEDLGNAEQLEKIFVDLLHD
jgi:hypothetical protein